MSGKQLATPSLEFRREVWPRDTHAGVIYVFKTMRLENHLSGGGEGRWRGGEFRGLSAGPPKLEDRRTQWRRHWGDESVTQRVTS